MTIRGVYEKLMIPPNLQEHMLRVGALMQVIAENWQGPSINIQALVLAGLGHDLANILKFDFSRPEMLGREAMRVDYWRKVQGEVVDKYGRNIHKATLLMGKEVGFDKNVLRVIEGLDWNRVKTVLKIQDWPVMIAIYADMRIGPKGILSLDERIDNLNQRRPINNYLELKRMAKQLEKAVQENTNIKLETITEADLTQRFEQLKQLRVEPAS